MELTEFVERYRNVAAALGDRIGSDVLEDLLVYLDTGEEGLAMEFLMGNLLRRHIPVTRREAVELAELLAYFEPPTDRRDERDTFYATLDDPSAAVAELTVVDEPSS